MQSGLLLEKSFRMAKSDLQARPIYHHLRDSIGAQLTVVFAALAVSRWIEHQTGWSIRKFVKTARRYRTIQIQAGPHAITTAGPLPGPRQSRDLSWFVPAAPLASVSGDRQFACGVARARREATRTFRYFAGALGPLPSELRQPSTKSTAGQPCTKLSQLRIHRRQTLPLRRRNLIPRRRPDIFRVLS